MKDKISIVVPFLGEVLDLHLCQNSFNGSVFPFVYEQFGFVAIECREFGKPTIVMEDGGGLADLLSQVNPSTICRDVIEIQNRLL